MLRRALLLPLVIACGNRDAAAPAPAPMGVTAGAAKAADPVRPPAAAAPPTPPTVPPSAADLAAAKRHLGRGRELGRLRRWQDAHAELLAGSALAPADPTLACELAWSSIMLGEHARAHGEAERALTAARQAHDRNHEAQALYNLGRAAEAAGDRDAARGDYQASLALRPSDPVGRRLARLSRPTLTCDDPDPIDCAGGPPADLCACLGRAAQGEREPDDAPASPTSAACATVAKVALGPAGFGASGPTTIELWRVGGPLPDDQSGAFLVAIETARGAPRATPLATIVSGLDGERRRGRRLTGRLELRAAGDVRYLYATTSAEELDEPVLGEQVVATTETAVVCPLTPTPRCTLRVPLHAAVHAQLDLEAIPDADADRRRAEFARRWGHRPPVTLARKLSLTIAPDGAATVAPEAKTAAADVTEWTGAYRAW
jgi:hypothetical protein